MNASGQDEPQEELAVAKLMIIERLSMGPRFGMDTEASAERLRLAMAAAFAAAAAVAEADKAAVAAAIALAERLIEAIALNGASIAEICAEALAPAMMLMPALCKVCSEASNAAS